MKRRVLGGRALVAWVLSVGLAGCGSAGVDTGVPPADQMKPVVPLDSISTDMSGRMSRDMGKAAKKAAEAAKAAEAGKPATEAPK
jgi:hypothetical protein